MNSVKFGGKDSYKDWGLVLNPKSRPLASPKTNYVSIEGKDGDLDLTTSLTGDVKYNNVSYDLEFTMLDKREDWENKLQEIATYLHGKKMNVIFTEDPEWYCVGRASVNKLKSSKGLGTIEIDCEFEPYKLKVNETIVTETIEANKVITLSNSRKWVMPNIKTMPKNQFNINNVLKRLAYNKAEPSITIEDANNFNIVNPVYDDWVGIYIIGLNPNKSYTFSFDATMTSYNNEADIIVSETSYGDNRIKLTLNEVQHISYTFTGSQEIHLRQAPATNITFADVQLEEGETETTFENNKEAFANFNFEGNTYSVNGTLKTPNIILKEGNSEITLTGGLGNIEVSYREGKL